MTKVDETIEKNWPKLLTTFIIGGLILAFVQFIATTMNSPAWAAVVGGFPLGLCTMYLVSADQSREYAKNYVFVTTILLCSAVVFYIVQTNMIVWDEGRKYAIVSMIIVFYAILIYFRTRYSSVNKLE